MTISHSFKQKYNVKWTLLTSPIWESSLQHKTIHTRPATYVFCTQSWFRPHLHFTALLFNHFILSQLFLPCSYDHSLSVRFINSIFSHKLPYRNNVKLAHFGITKQYISKLKKGMYYGALIFSLIASLSKLLNNQSSCWRFSANGIVVISMTFSLMVEVAKMANFGAGNGWRTCQNGDVFVSMFEKPWHSCDSTVEIAPHFLYSVSGLRSDGARTSPGWHPQRWGSGAYVWS